MITLQKKKNFNKNVNPKGNGPIKGQDEVIQLKRSEYDDLMASLDAVKTIAGMSEKIVETIEKVDMLFNGEVEIEIVDDGDKGDKKDKEKGDELPGDGGDVLPGDELPGDALPGEDEDPKAEDADLVETLKDPEKRKAVLEFLKATDEKGTKAAEKPKREIKRKTIQKAQDKKEVPNFTSRFEPEIPKEPLKGADGTQTQDTNLSEAFSNRFN